MCHSGTWLSGGWDSAGLRVRLYDFKLKQFYSSMKAHHSLTIGKELVILLCTSSQELKPDSKGNKDQQRRGNGVQGSAGPRHMSVRGSMVTLNPLAC